MRFHYISGRGTNPKGRMKWQQIKGAIESELIELMGANCWRPAAIDGEPTDTGPKIVQIARPAFKLLAPFRSLYVKGQDLGLAMLYVTAKGFRGRIFENAEIRELAEEARRA